MINLMEYSNLRGNVPLRYARGHFATNHSHINYYIDITYQKTRLSEAKAVARQLKSKLNPAELIDTILCLDGTAVIGTCLAEELSLNGFRNINNNQSIYVVEPEYNANSQILFRDNLKPMFKGKHVLILMASLTTGFTAKRSIEAIGYYGGFVAGVAAMYSAVDAAGGYPVASVYSLSDLPDYASYDYRECPYCKQGIPIDALVNSFGYSKL
ncbi:MAG: orotate phosphoribosyltransferase [Oscillospiraceae bacterium]|nr:orotate phosphoribosyltransferase [Oscillospiraceae bacterium]